MLSFCPTLCNIHESVQIYKTRLNSNMKLKQSLALCEWLPVFHVSSDELVARPGSTLPLEWEEEWMQVKTPYFWMNKLRGLRLLPGPLLCYFGCTCVIYWVLNRLPSFQMQHWPLLAVCAHYRRRRTRSSSLSLFQNGWHQIPPPSPLRTQRHPCSFSMERGGNSAAVCVCMHVRVRASQPVWKQHDIHLLCESVCTDASNFVLLTQEICPSHDASQEQEGQGKVVHCHWVGFFFFFHSSFGFLWSCLQESQKPGRSKKCVGKNGPAGDQDVSILNLRTVQKL